MTPVARWLTPRPRQSDGKAKPSAKVPRLPLRLPALGLLILWAALMLLIPNELVIPQIGSAGTPANLLGLGFLLWWVCGRLAGLVPARITPVHVVLGLLAVCVLLSMANGILSGWTRPADVHQETDAVFSVLPISLDELYDKSLLAASRGLIAIGSWIGVALVIADGLKSWRELERFIAWTLWFTTAVALIGLFQYFTGNNLAQYIRIPGLSANYEFGASISRSVLNRVSATTTHPIEFSVVLTTLFPLAMHRALHAHQTTRLQRVLSAYLPAVAIGLAIPMTVSRTGILALFIAMLVLFIGWPPRWRLIVLVFTPPVAIVMRSALPGLLGTIRSLVTQSVGDPSVTGRTDDYGVVLGIYSDHWVLGRGAFTFIPQYYRILDNQYLMNLLELGLVGFMVVLGMFTVGYYVSRHLKRHGTTPERRHLGLALSASVLAVASTYATFDAWSFAKAGGTTFLVLGIAAATWRLQAEQREEETVAHGQ
jgi:hypothetical protein